MSSIYQISNNNHDILQPFNDGNEKEEEQILFWSYQFNARTCPQNTHKLVF